MSVNSNLNTPKSNQSVTIVRKPTVVLSVVLGTTTPTNATEIDYRHAAAGRVIVTSSNVTGTTINWWEAFEPGGTYVQCYNGGTIVTSTLPGGAASCEIPAALAGSMFLKMSMNADQGETVTVVLKA